MKDDGGYYCKCMDGSVGDNCKSHPCMTNVCGNYGICKRKNANYICSCIPGYIYTLKIDNLDCSKSLTNLIIFCY